MIETVLLSTLQPDPYALVEKYENYVFNYALLSKDHPNLVKTGFTHLSRMEFPSLINWTSPFEFSVLRVVG